jgi:hypothetical protein
MPDFDISDILLTMRSWVYHNNVGNVDDWQWAKATQYGEWVRIPWCQETSPAQRRTGGAEKRFVPTHHQVLPGITRMGGLIPESRPGWPDNYMNHDKSASMTPGVYTYIDLEKDHRWLGNWSDFLGDGCVYYLV